MPSNWPDAPPNNSYNIIPSVPARPPFQPQVSPVASAPQVVDIPDDSGSKAYLRDVVKIKRTKTPVATPYARTTKVTNEDPIRFVNCGMSLYRDDALLSTGIQPGSFKLDIRQSNLFVDLQRKVWDLFSPRLVGKDLLMVLPNDPMQRTSLTYKKATIDQDTLILLAKKSTLLKPIQIDLVYEDDGSDLPTELPATSTSRRAKMQTNQITQRQAPRTRAVTSHVCHAPTGNHQLKTSPVTKTGATDSNWAEGGVAATVPARGTASLSTHMKNLGKPLSCVIDINPEGWIIAQRLKLLPHDLNSGSQPELAKYHYLKATTAPLTLKIDKNSVFGQGSMRIAYSAQVKTEGRQGSPPSITNWVAKMRYRDPSPNLGLHATDARMYEACAHLLRAYQTAITNCHSEALPAELRQKAMAFQLVRHCVIFTGSPSCPTDVYFLELALQGHYVKYSSNIYFAVPSDQPGIDIDNLAIMNAFTHWSYVTSNEASLICDLQGVGSTLTDPQILDRDNDRWADGNNATQGICRFVEDHRCNVVCQALALRPPTMIIPDPPAPPNPSTAMGSGSSNRPAAASHPGGRGSIANVILSDNSHLLDPRDFFRSELNIPTADRNPQNTSEP
ncbi:hypothetical protein MJO28_010143 [Puccinia striiformis f. sp. tritici]|uniref:Uncharacterized protein n=1 Tax=Puccinia striiformis f. sp. tritici TaxID=168172 RepID=A0ACC0E5M0_9BASI|nr:hypothetical protein MJO28_010143 [Puccinia striiformis f. sp. tritici]